MEIYQQGEGRLLKTLSVSMHTYADFKEFEDFQLYEHIYAHWKTLKTSRGPFFPVARINS